MTGVTTPTSRTQTRFGCVTRVPIMAALPTAEPEGQAKPRAGSSKQRRLSEKPVKTKSDKVSIVDKHKQLQEKIEELTAKLEEYQNESHDNKRKKWNNQESSEAEFLFEEQRINERESFEKQIAVMQERMDLAEGRLEACRSALESAGINAVSFERIEALKSSDLDDLESKTKAIGEEILKGHENARSLISEIEDMFNDDDLDSLFETVNHIGNEVAVS